jgi:hypothetical protein
MEFNFPDNIGLVPPVHSEQPGAEAERKLTTDINDLWSVHVQAQNTVATTKEELKAIRQHLGERLHEMKQLLARPGRNGQWSSFLQQHGIPRTTADRLIAGHKRSLAPEANCASGTFPTPTKQDIQRLLTSDRPTLAKTLTTPDSIFTFLHFVILRADIPHEYRDEGILMYRPIVAMSGEPEFVALVDAPAADPANDDYAAVL